MKLIKLFTWLTLLVIPASFAQTPSMSQAQLLSLLNAPKSVELLVLDVRSPEEFSDAHIAGAINISYDQLAQQYQQLAKFKDKTVVVYCRSGRRAGIAEALLAEKGFSRLRHLSGDMNGWQAANLPTVSQ